MLSAAITAVLGLFADKGIHRDWLVAAGVALVVFAIGSIDLMRESPRETHWATWIIGSTLPVAVTTGALHATRAMKPWQRWPLMFLMAFVFLFLGLFLGASIVPRFIGG